MNKRVGFLSVLLIASLGAGCASDRGIKSLTAPGPNATPAAQSFSNSTTVVIGPGGGEVATALARVVIPSGALASDVVFTLQSGSDASGVHCRLSPDNVGFAASATLDMNRPAWASPGRLFRILMTDPQTGAQTDLGGTLVEGRMRTLITQSATYDDVDEP
jgi:hypothetical protein